ncbi:unnamed protein product [Cochlearia groenlandica]
MEADGQRLHSVLSKTEVLEKMKKEIEQISEVFSVSRSDATVILISLRWNSFQVSDRLGEEDKEKFLSKLGLGQESILSSENQETESKGICDDDDDDGSVMVSTPFCSHKYGIDYWRDYLTESLEKEERVTLLLCPNKDCVASVGPETIEKLPETVKEIYDKYVLGSFMESKKETIKWCPASGCDYAIELGDNVVDDDDDGEETNGFGVVCLCGHTFCWTCKVESHRPVTCNNASLWCSSLDQSRSLMWLAKNTKHCPSCNTLFDKNDAPAVRKYVTCTCSCRFCYICLRSEEDHILPGKCREAIVPQPINEYNLTHHLVLWDRSHEAMDKAKAEHKDMELKTIPKLTKNRGLSEEDIRVVREASMLVVQCSLVLKWSSVFGYFITDYHIAKKQYLNHLRDEAEATLLKHRETLHALMKQAASGVDFGLLKHMLKTTTENTGNYFHFLVNTVESGLPDVKVDVYENVPSLCWYCDRCTFQNNWDDNECKMCFVSLDSPPPSPHVAATDNNNDNNNNNNDNNDNDNNDNNNDNK